MKTSSYTDLLLLYALKHLSSPVTYTREEMKEVVREFFASRKPPMEITEDLVDSMADVLSLILHR